MHLLGFNGKMGVGKSTAIECLKDLLPANSPVKLVKFAQPLYDMQEFIYRRISSVHERDASFTKDRKLLQWLGTEWGRGTVNENIWVDIWQKEVESASAKSIVVCDDVRFDNEAETMARLGGTIVQITSNDSQNRIDTKAGIVQHSSEAGIDSRFIDFTVENNGTRLQYLDQLTALYKQLGLVPNER
jgi:energy-coupling factor transporter ATP-binding protein EcfA2